MCAAFRCSIKQANCQLAIQQKQQETLYDKHTHISHRQPWNKVWDTGISVLSMAACVSSHLLVVLFTFMRVNNVFVCVCVCVCVWRPVETVITATWWGHSETACCTSSCHYRSTTSSPPATTVWGLSSALPLFLCFYIFLFFFSNCRTKWISLL